MIHGIRKSVLVIVLLTVCALSSCDFRLVDLGEFKEVQLTSSRTVPFIINSTDLLETQDNRLRIPGFRSYAPNLDHRRRIVANSWVRSATLRGPAVGGLRLAFDQCRENEIAPSLGSPCTAVPAEERDHLEFGWLPPGADIDFVFGDGLNRAFRRETLSVPMATSSDGRGLSFAFPGAQLRFVSGPAVPYSVPPLWSTMADPPRGEGTGFSIGTITLNPSTPPSRGSTLIPTISPYEQVSGVLFGDAEDSFKFKLEPSPNAQSVAIFFQPGIPTSSVSAYARCEGPPTKITFDIQQSSAAPSGDSPLFLDFPAGSCPRSGWHVVIASEPTSRVPDIVFHFIVAERFAAREWSEIKVGIEFATSGPDEDQAIRAALREAAWKYFGMTGGTHIIRSFRYDLPGACSNVTICWRNRPEGHCPDGKGVTYPGTPIGSVHICSMPGDDVRGDAALLAHEFGHLFTGLEDEYWFSNITAQICGQSGIGIKRCSHSAMSITWSGELNSICNDKTHDSAPELIIQTAPGVWNPNKFTVAGPYTRYECWNGERSHAGTHAASGWNQMYYDLGIYPRGIIPHPHPDWSPINFNYRVFANSPARNEIGQNLP